MLKIKFLNQESCNFNNQIIWKILDKNLCSKTFIFYSINYLNFYILINLMIIYNKTTLLFSFPIYLEYFELLILQYNGYMTIQILMKIF